MRVPQGYHDLYGIVSDVGATAAPQQALAYDSKGERWMTVQLVGEVIEATFERGISQYPSIKDEVHLVTKLYLSKIYGTVDVGQVAVGRLAAAESIPVKVDLDRLVTRHSAVLGSTGSGKSTTVASLLRSISAGHAGEKSFPSARVLLLDVHGEYAHALKGVAKTFRINPTDGSEPLFVPYWAIDLSVVLGLLLGNVEEKALTSIFDRVFLAKQSSIAISKFAGVDAHSLSINSPIPYSLKKLWYDLIDPEIKTTQDNQGNISARTDPGSPEALAPPVYPPASLGSTAPFVNKIGVLSIRRQLAQMRSRLMDRQYDFMMRPGPWEPKLDGTVESDLGALLESWIGHDKPITILDLSGVPSLVMTRLIGGILNIIYEGLFWGRELPMGGRRRPQLIVMEEAHRYLGKEDESPAREMVQRIVKEGRKFGVGAMIVVSTHGVA